MEQSVRIDNIWESATSYLTFTVGSADQAVEIVYTPEVGEEEGAGVFLNGFEIDTPALENQISFPQPLHRDERIEPADGESIVASWTPSSTPASYDVYLGTSPEDLQIVDEALNGTQTTLTGRYISSSVCRFPVLLNSDVKASTNSTPSTGVLMLSRPAPYIPAGSSHSDWLR